MNQRRKTEQEAFWAGSFGDQYVARNLADEIVAGNCNLFSKALSGVGKISSVVEFGANIGLNLRALKTLFPGAILKGIEINVTAFNLLCEEIGESNAIHGSILDQTSLELSDLVLVKGVLIHIAPEDLNFVYDLMHKTARRHILICEYYNPSPVALTYRGNSNKLFKRDFAGEMLDRFVDLQLVKYGFQYHRDPTFPLDDVSWFLLEKSEGGA